MARHVDPAPRAVRRDQGSTTVQALLALVAVGAVSILLIAVGVAAPVLTLTAGAAFPAAVLLRGYAPPRRARRLGRPVLALARPIPAL